MYIYAVQGCTERVIIIKSFFPLLVMSLYACIVDVAIMTFMEDNLWCALFLYEMIYIFKFVLFFSIFSLPVTVSLYVTVSLCTQNGFKILNLVNCLFDGGLA